MELEWESKKLKEKAKTLLKKDYWSLMLTTFLGGGFTVLFTPNGAGNRSYGRLLDKIDEMEETAANECD